MSRIELQPAIPKYQDPALREVALQEGGVSRLIREGAIEDWDELGLCLENPMIFTPATFNARTMRTAKKLCESCVVKDRCFERNLDEELTSGVIAGLGPTEWRKIIKRKRQKAKEEQSTSS